MLQNGRHMTAILNLLDNDGEPPSNQVHLIALMKSILMIKDFGKYCGTMNGENLESKALCKVQQFHECSFCSNRRNAAGKQLVYLWLKRFLFIPLLKDDVLTNQQ